MLKKNLKKKLSNIKKTVRKFYKLLGQMEN